MLVFDFKDYKIYMKKILTRGMRTQLADVLGCHIGFISQVLRGSAHFSLEHSMRICKFLSLSEKESSFFMLLVQKAKAGSFDLEEFFEKQIRDFLDSREQISERVQRTNSLSKEDRVQYFSSSNYALIHMALSIPDYQNPQKIMKELNIDLNEVNDVINFLLEKGLIVFKEGKYITGPTRLHLEKKSPLVVQHHTNTRVETIKSLSRNAKDDLHYSGIFTMTANCSKKVRDILLRSIEESDKEIGNSKNERLYIFGIDFFEY